MCMNMESQTPYGLFLILLVLVLSGLAINKALDQRDSRLREMANIRSQFEYQDIVNNDVKNTFNMVYDDVNSVKTEINTKEYEANLYKKVAGCYGLLQENSTEFSLTCNRYIVP